MVLIALLGPELSILLASNVFILGASHSFLRASSAVVLDHPNMSRISGLRSHGVLGETFFSQLPSTFVHSAESTQPRAIICRPHFIAVL